MYVRFCSLEVGRCFVKVSLCCGWSQCSQLLCRGDVALLCNNVPQMVEEGSTLLRRMEICVAEAEKRSGKNAVGMQETFTVYLIETR